MTIGVIVIFVACIVAGMGFTYLSGLAMRAEERFFNGWILGIVAFTLVGLVTTRLFTFDGPAVALAVAVVAALSLFGWKRADSFVTELIDLRERAAVSLLRTQPDVAARVARARVGPRRPHVCQRL